MHTDRHNAQDTADLVSQELFNPDITLEGPIRLKDLTRQATRELERKIILKVLEAQRWNRKRTAEVLSMSYRVQARPSWQSCEFPLPVAMLRSIGSRSQSPWRRLY
jgi:transcriptional regulator with GAF, ATPase, and Fis domain